MIVEKLVELINQGLSFENICKEICTFRDEKELFFIGDLKYNGASYLILAIVTAIWFVTAMMLAVGGVIIIINRKQVYFEYSDRPYSSKL